MKSKTIFLLMFGFWLLDFLTTIYVLNVVNGIAELNPLASFLFKFGWYGYLFMIGISAFLSFLFSFALSKIAENYAREKSFIITLIPTLAFCSLELFAIINNLHWIFG